MLNNSAARINTGRNLALLVAQWKERRDYEATRIYLLFSRFVRDESGATAIEYGLIAAGISIAIIAVVNGLGTKLKTTFSSISLQLK